MKILAFDTTLPKISICVANKSEVLAACELISKKDTSSKLFVWIDKLLNALNMSRKDINLIGVTRGPGSFTGIRIGLAAVKGLAYSLNVKVTAFSTLEVMAFSTGIRDALLFPIINAKRGMFYGALFRFKNSTFERLTPDSLFLPDEIKAMKDKVVFVGEAASLLSLNYIPVVCIASFIPKLFVEKGRILELSELTPNYLRVSDAEEKYGIVVD